MSKDIRIKRGLSLRLEGAAEKELVKAPRSKTYAIKPPDFHTVVPKMVVKEGAKLLAGDELFYSKYTDQIRFTTPVSGVLKEIKRGDKRRILEIIIEADVEDTYRDFGKMDASKADAKDVKERILESGCGAFIIQRPYDIVADPKDTPKAIFISAVTTAPLAADKGFIIKDKIEAFQEGINALRKLTPGKVHVSVDDSSAEYLKNIQGVELHHVKGAHPAGNVGVQIHKIDPLNRGERVWTVGVEDVAIIGNVFLTGQYRAERTIAVTGSEAKDRKYYHGIIGGNVADLIGQTSEDVRIISGTVLTGTKLSNNQYLGFYPNEVTLIPEGNNYRMFGWLPFTYNNIHSNSHTSLSWLFPKRKYTPTTNLNVEERALVVTGEMEEVLPMDVYPMQLIKACMAGDIEKMENLGIYEVAPEDFALVEYVNTSKIEIQEVIRLGLDLMITEVG
ncbi:Na(+)-translocating NADH-quinone reductase subunit A [Christiangramia sabulilitoris]|uniref:Na(+)-translocating NADH-quinone reductase subunit A n=1 Tax=Christiangramia sabulilitoris TaxID=2583991 RepID=A0A550HZ85_9FLAO|nr:Na(+)-translocating NADH-quinone reductase subunit A [Christiangramia sabulilitoris]TRO64039.1 Na(+)-translocating NADH-quinone reductase subunit A [Christiangramia sabulilitoris]